MKVPTRVSFLFFLGVLIAGSSALGYYYYFVYEPPLGAAARFLEAMELADKNAVKEAILVSTDLDAGKLREATDREVEDLLAETFQRGRILDQRRTEGATRDLYYLVYREPDGRVFALIATEMNGEFRIVVPETPVSQRRRYLWDYVWSN
jgi:hypothetical protein